MLSSRSTPIFLLFSTLLQLTYGRHHKPVEISEWGGNDFDILVFTQHWPETFCIELKEKEPSRRCLLPRHEEWSIHGLWPDQFHKLAPLFCNKTLHFNETALTPILNELDEKWINVEGGTPHFSFWKHEWDKHGTCAIVLEDLNSEFKYFKKSLDLLDQYDMTHILAKANILPGQNYALQEIIDGVQKILGKTIVVTCFKNPKTQESYLDEIRICLDKSLKLTNCDEVIGFPTNCDRRKPVNYPSGTPTQYNVILI